MISYAILVFIFKVELGCLYIYVTTCCERRRLDCRHFIIVCPHILEDGDGECRVLAFVDDELIWNFFDDERLFMMLHVFHHFQKTCGLVFAWKRYYRERILVVANRVIRIVVHATKEEQVYHICFPCLPCPFQEPFNFQDSIWPHSLFVVRAQYTLNPRT